MSDAVIQSIVTAVVTIALAWIAARKLNAIGKTTDKVHVLVNNNMMVQLRLNALVTRRLATLTKEPVDVDAALLAEKLLAEQVAKQAVVDAGAAAAIKP